MDTPRTPATNLSAERWYDYWAGFEAGEYTARDRWFFSGFCTGAAVAVIVITVLETVVRLP